MAWTTPRTFVTGEVETASIFNTHLRDNLEAGFPHGTTFQTYTPTLTASTTNPTLGSGSTQSGRYYRVGRFVIVHFLIEFGTSGTAAGSGSYQVSLPVTSTSSTTTAWNVGGAHARDSSATTHYVLTPLYGNSSVLLGPDGGNLVSDTVPFAWGASDRLTGTLVYEAAT